jgi:hypothetical protein
MISRTSKNPFILIDEKDERPSKQMYWTLYQQAFIPQN